VRKDGWTFAKFQFPDQRFFGDSKSGMLTFQVHSSTLHGSKDADSTMSFLTKRISGLLLTTEINSKTAPFEKPSLEEQPLVIVAVDLRGASFKVLVFERRFMSDRSLMIAFSTHAISTGQDSTAPRFGAVRSAACSGMFGSGVVLRRHLKYQILANHALI
jgi:hypothetical protein